MNHLEIDIITDLDAYVHVNARHRLNARAVLDISYYRRTSPADFELAVLRLQLY